MHHIRKQKLHNSDFAFALNFHLYTYDIEETVSRG